MSMDSTAANALASELIGKTVSGWAVDRVINHGKSAVVLHATRGSDEGAVKVFDRGLLEQFGRDHQLTRIRRELLLRGKVHPHLVRIFDGGFSDELNVAFVVMGFLPFQNLASLLPRVTPDRIWPLLSQIASAARFLESLELYHRDIKPENIALSPDFQTAVLLDLGVLRPDSASGDGPITDFGKLNFVGTLQYSSPEYLFRRTQDDARAFRALTFYQLGAVLHDMIMHRRIFADFEDPYPRLVEAIQTAQPSIDAPNVDPHLVQLAKTCLLKDPEKRLELLTWDSFQEPTSLDRSVDLAIQIRRRMATAAEAAVLQPDPRVAIERRSVVNAVKSLVDRFGNLLRHERAQSTLLPPMEVDETLGAADNIRGVTVVLPPSADHLLRATLRFWFRLELRDTAGLVVRIRAAVALCGRTVEGSDAEPHLSELFDGVFEDAIVAGHLRLLLLSALDEAQTAGAVEADAMWLGSQTRTQ